MPILGYGEDALTFHALSNGLTDILKQLGDGSDPTESIRFFRPSFGRRGSPSDMAPRSQFGEFDAIIGTTCGVYLIEAKWSNSSEFVGAVVELRSEQKRRHQVFRIYLDEWRRQPPNDWQDFATRVRPLLHEAAPGIVPPSVQTKLARNLSYVLRRLSQCGPKVVDVLLFSACLAVRLPLFDARASQL